MSDFKLEEVDVDAPGMTKRKIRKAKYRSKLVRCLNTFKNILLVNVDNVGSNQMQKVRISLRGKAEVLMGKNTVIRKVIRDALESRPKLECLLPYVYGNMGFVFTNDSLSEVRKIILENKVPAAAKSGGIAPCDVIIQPGPTGLDPGQTAFFQALNIATKIARGSIEILNPVTLIKEGDKVNSSAVALLSKLNLRPFFYGIGVTDVYEDGFMYSAKILDMSQEDLLRKFFNGVRHVAALSLALGHPTAASIGHSIKNGFKKLLSISLATDYTFEEAKVYKNFLENPELLKAATAPAAGAAAPKEEDEDEEEEEDESEGGAIGGGMFGDD